MKKFFAFLLVLAFLQIGTLSASQQFLWKPASENDGKLVVLFPSKLRIENVQAITVNGNVKPAKTSQTGANGDRIHARFSQAGQSFGKNVEVKVVTRSGETYTWTIPDGKNRFEKITDISTSAGAGGKKDKATGKAGREVIYRWTDRDRNPQLQFIGSWYFQHESAYTTKYQGKRDAKGEAVCKPDLTGKYEIFASFRATENRGTAAKYLIDGKLVRTENQRSVGGGGKHSEKFPEILLGVFELTSDSVVKMKADDGQSYSFTSFRFRPSDGAVSEVGENSTFGDLISAEAPQGVIRLTNDNQGTKEYTVQGSGELTVDALLSTYGPAELWICDAAGNEILGWRRRSDVDPAKLVVNGQEIAGSNVEVKPGDFTPVAQNVKIKVAAGETITAHLSGSFGNAGSYLVVNE